MKLVRLLLIALAIAITLAVLLNCPKAGADSGNFGPGPMPGLCTYPSVCTVGGAGAIVATYWLWEDWPVESNGSHRRCHYLVISTNGNVQVGFSMMITASVGAEGLVGGGEGGCHYVCPDGRAAKDEFPNPPGAWRDAIRPTKCQAGGPDPFAPPPPPQDVPIAPPIPVQGALLPDAPPAEVLPSQTLPVCGNPDATVTTAC